MLLNFREKQVSHDDDLIVFSKSNNCFIQISKDVFLSNTHKTTLELQKQIDLLKKENSELRSQISQIAKILKEKI